VAKAAAPALLRGGGSSGNGSSGGGSNGSSGGGDYGAAVLAEVATMKSDMAEFRSEMKKDLKVGVKDCARGMRLTSPLGEFWLMLALCARAWQDLQKAVVMMNATVEHVLALVKLGAD